jgi:hypothetical protein
VEVRGRCITARTIRTSLRIYHLSAPLGMK